MMLGNSCRLRGNLTDEPRLIALKGSGVPFMRFYLAVERRLPASNDGPLPVDYFEVVSYGPRAARDFPFLQKGSEVLVEGWIRMRLVSNGKRPRRTYEVVAENILFLRNIAWDQRTDEETAGGS